jgi:hypothetical protein
MPPLASWPKSLRGRGGDGLVYAEMSNLRRAIAVNGVLRTVPNAPMPKLYR